MTNVVEADPLGNFVESDSTLGHLRAAGRALALSLRRVEGHRNPSSALKNWKKQAAGLAKVWAALRRVPAQVHAPNPAIRSLRENKRLLNSALTRTKDAIQDIRDLPAIQFPEHTSTPRALIVAESFLSATAFRFDEQLAIEFLDGFQEVHELEMHEIWALKTLVQLLLIAHIAGLGLQLLQSAQGRCPELPRMVESLRRIGDSDWKELFECVSGAERLLRQDPSGVYSRMDFDSRDRYRVAVEHLSRYSAANERQVVEAALKLAQESKRYQLSDSRWTRRLGHAGFYLIDEGRPLLEKRIGYQPPPLEKVRRWLKDDPDLFYLTGIGLSTFLIVVCVLSALSGRTAILAGFLLLLIPATQSAVELMNHLVTFLFPPSRLPKLDLSAGVPSEYSTIVAVPALLLNETQVRGLVEDLEVRFLANRDPNIHYLLLSDSPDSAQAFDEKDDLVSVACALIEALNKKYAGRNCGKFLLLHRHRVYYKSEEAWLGWERKRGKLLALNSLMRNGEDTFPVKAGDLSVLSGVRYVITLDADTQLPRGAAHRMIGTIAHPLNQAIIDPATNIVFKGYGILQPRVGVSIESANQSRLANIYSGLTGFDIYTRAVSDVYQDLYGEGSFTGKGIYEVDTLRAVLEKRFPGSALLSHDLIEGAYARAGLVSDIEVIDDYPTHFSAYNRRKHRWVRGDWQTLSWLFGRVPDESGKPVRNPISLVSRWKILDNLRRSLIEPAAFALLLAGWFHLPGGPLFWTCTSVALLFLPVALDIAFSLIRFLHKPAFPAFRDLLAHADAAIFGAQLRVVFLAHQTLVDLDAIVRSNFRRMFTRKRMLEWETAAEAELGQRKRTPVDFYLDCMPLVALAVAVLLLSWNRPALNVAWPFLALWALSSWITRWLNRPSNARRSEISGRDQEMLRSAALRTWRYFRYFSNPRTNWLVPDNVQEIPARIAYRISPTNLGLLLNSRLVALDLGFCTLAEFVGQTGETLRAMERMPRCRGHFYNWYDTQTLRPLPPVFVSTVDSGNLAGSLWTLKQACLEMRRAPLFPPSLWQGLRDHLSLLQSLSPEFADLGTVADSLGDEAPAWLRELPGLQAELTQRPACEELTWWMNETVSRLESLGKLANDFAPWLLPEYEPLRSIIDAALPETLLELTLDNVSSWIRRVSGALRSHRANPLAQSLIGQLDRAAQHAAALRDDLENLADDADRLVDEMDFRMLCSTPRKLLSIGYNASEDRLEPAMYDLLASESRLASFIAVAKGDVPQESWFRLGREQTRYRGEHLLLSWTGTLFEYLMPSLWMKSYPDTLLDRSLRAVLLCQRKYARKRNVPWGISESAYAYRDETGDYQYQAFGIPALALNENASRALVVSPYSTFLAMSIDPSAAIANLKQINAMNWTGPFGFYESADYTAPAVKGRRREHEVIRSWMAHHQGMILLSICNLLCGNSMQRRFHAEPMVMATELILHERPMPATAVNTENEFEPELPAVEAAAAVGA